MSIDNIFLKHELTYLGILFGPTNTPTPKGIQFPVRKNKENKSVCFKYILLEWLIDFQNGC